MPSVREGELVFQFPKEVSCERFDGPEHGLSNRKMKAVDFILDAEDSYYFLEVKDPNHTKAKKKNQTKFAKTMQSGELRNDLIQKFRDTFLYRYAEDKLDKPVHYLVLIDTPDRSLMPHLSDELKRNLPLKKASTRWKRPLAKSCLLLTPDMWKKHFPDWTIERVARSKAL